MAWNRHVLGFIITEVSTPDQIQGLSWKGDGRSLVTTCKDKTIRIFDPRQQECSQVGFRASFSRALQSLESCLFEFDEIDTSLCRLCTTGEHDKNFVHREVFI